MDCLFLPPGCSTRIGPHEPLYWLPDDAMGRYLGLDECASVLQGRPVAVVLPAEVCSAFAVALPTDKARWIRKALPYALLECLAEDVEHMHLALGERLEDGRYRVLAVRRELLAGWLQQLREQGLMVAAIHMDADMLPREASQLLAVEGRFLLGGGNETRMACRTENWPALAGRCPLPLYAYGEQPDTAPQGCGSYHFVEDPYRFLAESRSGAVDFAQGDLAIRTPSNGRALLKPLLACALFWLLVHLTFDLARSWYLTRQGDVLDAASLALYQELFPKDLRIVNLRAQFEDHLRRSEQNSGPVGFLGLLEHSATVLGGLPMVTVLQLDYHDASGELSMQVRALDFSTLEQLRQRFTDVGMEVRMGSASREEGGVTTRMVIHGAVGIGGRS